METLPRTVTAWKTLMALQDTGKVKYIGVSNTYDVEILEALERDGGRRVQVVQNRWYEGNEWDKDVLSYCRKYGIQYQYAAPLFPILSLDIHLTSNPQILLDFNGCPESTQALGHHSVSTRQIVHSRSGTL